MVYLSRIYTKSGDAGETGLGDGQRVPKNHPRVTAYGEVDELNAAIGLVLLHSPPDAELLRTIQNELFDLGADLCIPLALKEREGATIPEALRVTPEQVKRLEEAIDRCNERLQPLQSFVIPGGSVASAWLHWARTVARRAERAVVTLMQAEPVNPQVLIYLNRLSDYLFVLARVANAEGQADITWIPGKSR